jgi:murein DD-endopeptidase MepM/ murein hydrolase activator NlpD
MAFEGLTAQASMKDRVREIFQSRDLFFHDGKTLRRVHLSMRAQLLAVAGVALCGISGIAGVASLAISSSTVTKSIYDLADRRAAISTMETRVADLQAEVELIRRDAKTHAARIEKRHAFISSLVTGSGDAKELSALLPGGAFRYDPRSADVRAAFSGVEAFQSQVATQLLAAKNAEYGKRVRALTQLGVDPRRLQAAMGGPYEPVTTVSVPAPAAGQQGDPQFRALFNSWKRLDQLDQGMVAIPSAKPVDDVSITSGFGVRSDPFRGGAAMHSGLDIPGPIGTPIRASADGIVGRAGWVSGYGRLIELEHGRGIVTRYGHLSAINVAAGSRIKRGQLIGLMGSSGRSTGSHLHYEVRLDGRAVNPIPFLRATDYLVALQRRTQEANVALGGPAKGE